MPSLPGRRRPPSTSNPCPQTPSSTPLSASSCHGQRDQSCRRCNAVSSGRISPWPYTFLVLAAATSPLGFQSLAEIAGAGEENRTPVISLEGCCSTIELHPRLGEHSQTPTPRRHGLLAF